jgi:ADP-ribose pyrophosphatase
MKEHTYEAAHPWQTVGTAYPLTTPWLKIRRDQVVTHLAREITYTFVEHPGSVLIVPVTPDGCIVLLRQYRYIINDWCWEIPAGSLEEHRLEAKEDAARRELLEETGGICHQLFAVSTFYTNNSLSTEECTVYLAPNTQLGPPDLEHSELLYPVVLPWREVLAMVQRGEMKDGPSALAILLCQPHIERLYDRIIV